MQAALDCRWPCRAIHDILVVAGKPESSLRHLLYCFGCNFSRPATETKTWIVFRWNKCCDKGDTLVLLGAAAVRHANPYLEALVSQNEHLADGTIWRLVDPGRYHNAIDHDPSTGAWGFLGIFGSLDR